VRRKHVGRAAPPSAEKGGHSTLNFWRCRRCWLLDVALLDVALLDVLLLDVARI